MDARPDEQVVLRTRTRQLPDRQKQEGNTEARRRELDKNSRHTTFHQGRLGKVRELLAWAAYVVNRGGQKNFTQFMTFIKAEFGELPDTWEPTPDEFKRYISKAILFRDVQRIVKAEESITAYRINVTTYLVSLLAEKTARRIDLDAIWKARDSKPLPKRHASPAGYFQSIA